MTWGHGQALTPPGSSEQCYPKPSSFICSQTALACHFVPGLLSGQTCPSDLADSLFRAEWRSRSMWGHDHGVCVMLGVSYLCSVGDAEETREQVRRRVATGKGFLGTGGQSKSCCNPASLCIEASLMGGSYCARSQQEHPYKSQVSCSPPAIYPSWIPINRLKQRGLT